MVAVEQQMRALQAALEAGTASAAALQVANSALSAERAAAAAADEVKKLAGVVTRLTADLDEVREQLSTVKVSCCSGTCCRSSTDHEAA